MAVDNVNHETSIAPASAPVAAQRSTEDQKKFYDTLRERLKASPFKVTAPPGLTAYWARKDDAQEMARLDLRGFRIVREANLKLPRYRANGLKADGTYVMGDVILMEIETEAYEFYLEDNRDRAKAMVDGVPQSFQMEAEKVGVPVFTKNKGKER